MPNPSPAFQFQAIQQTVQHNCHIADAHQAGDYTLCVYLLKMREFYRWEQNQAFSARLEQNSVGSWLREREQLWDKLADNDFTPLTIDNKKYEPFDTDAINSALAPHGLVYSGGLGIKTRPHFFLGKLKQLHEHSRYRVYISAEEYARDLTAPPAMALGNTIFIRREAVKRMLWEKVDTWNWNKPDNALGRAIKFYDFDTDIDTALETMTEAELKSILLHEIGEVKAGELLGPQWEAMLVDMPHTKAELMLRAARDHLADALSTLPMLLGKQPDTQPDKQRQASIHFYMGNLSNMRKHLYPGLLDAYESWQESGDITVMQDMVNHSKQHWQQTTQDALRLALQPKVQDAIVDLIENHRLHLCKSLEIHPTF